MSWACSTVQARLLTLVASPPRADREEKKRKHRYVDWETAVRKVHELLDQEATRVADIDSPPSREELGKLAKLLIVSNDM